MIIANKNQILTFIFIFLNLYVVAAQEEVDQEEKTEISNKELLFISAIIGVAPALEIAIAIFEPINPAPPLINIYLPFRLNKY